MYFNVKIQEKTPPYIVCEIRSWKQNIWVKSFSCILIAEIDLQLKKKILTCFVFYLNFVNYTTNEIVIW
jgi:hypothetical protein